MKRLAICLAAAVLAVFARQTLAAGWMGTVQAGAAYPAPNFPSHIEELDRGETQWQWGVALDYQLSEFWAIGIDGGGVEVPYAEYRQVPGSFGVGTRNAFRLVTAGLRGTYVWLPGHRYRPFGLIGMGGGVVREELAERHCSAEFATCFDELSYQQTNAFSGEIALGLDSRIASLPPTLHVLVSGDYHYLAAAMRPAVSSVQYFGFSLGLALASRGAR